MSMDTLSLFGLFAVTAMLVAYALEDRSHWFILAFAGACALGSVYGFIQGAWPFGLVEAIWAGVALRRWIIRRRPRGWSASGANIASRMRAAVLPALRRWCVLARPSRC